VLASSFSQLIPKYL